MVRRTIDTTHPDIADELVDQTLRFKISPYSKEKVEWRCKNGHTWSATPSNRTTRHSQCPYCSGRKALPGTNDLATTHPELAKQLVDRKLATQLTAGSNKKVKWRCKEGHIWEATANARMRGNDCPYCSHRKLLTGYNDMATLRPDLARQLKNPELAKTLMPSSKTKVEWVCDQGHTWLASPNARNRTKSQKGTNCPICTGKKVAVGFNDLATTNPKLARLCEHEEDAHKYTQHSAKAIEWRCPHCDAVFTAKISEMSTGKKACPNCAKRKAHDGKTDLATLRPDVAALLKDKSLATKLTVNSNKIVEWHCPNCNVTWKSKVQTRTSASSPCPFCSNKRVMAGVNDIATTDPELAAQMVDQELTTKITKGSARLVEWECKNGHRWFATVFNRSKANKPTNYPYCASAGTSEPEQELANIVRTLVESENVITNDRKLLDGQEIDILVPSHKLAIEFNGTYWHDERHHGMDYHQQKRKLCQGKDYDLIYIWQDTWQQKPELVIRLIAERLNATENIPNTGIVIEQKALETMSSQQLVPSTITTAETQMFLEANHIQGMAPATYHLGLKDSDGDIRAVVSLEPSKNREDGEWEIRRYATLGTIPDGLTALLSYAEQTIRADDHKLTKWISFAPCDTSTGKMYETCGFALDKELPPDYMYIDGRQTSAVRMPKQMFQLNRFRNDPNLVWDESWTEIEAAHANNLYRCWDSGQLRYTKNVE